MVTWHQTLFMWRNHWKTKFAWFLIREIYASIAFWESWTEIWMREKFVSELVYVSRWTNWLSSPVCKTGDLRFKSQLRHKFFSQYLSSVWTSILHRYVAVNTKFSFIIGHSNIWMYASIWRKNYRVCGGPEVRKNLHKEINSTMDKQLSWMA